MKFFLVLILLFFSSTAFANEKINEKEMKMGRLSYSAFECSIAAGMAKLDKENERLFLLGYNAANQFFEATKNKDPDASLVNDQISFTLVSIDVVNNDFAAGRVYQNIYELVFKDVANLTNLDLQKKKAQAYFNDKNCSLIK